MIIHLVGSIPLPDNESVFRKLAAKLGEHVLRMPDGETGIRQSWIRFLQDALANHPAVELATDLPPFRFVQWDGRLIREIPLKRLRAGASIEPAAFATGYAEMAIDSWRVFSRLQDGGIIAPGIKFQICLPTPIAPTYNNMIPEDRPRLLPALTRHLIDEVAKMTRHIPHDRMTIQWDVCQEVLAWEGYYEPGPVPFREETIAVLGEIGDAVPRAVELGYHLCYGSPQDEHIVQPQDTGVMVEMIHAILARVGRPIAYFHVPVPKPRIDDGYFAPLDALALPAATELYIGLVHAEDDAGNAARLAAARRHTRVDGVAAECGLGRGDPRQLDALLDAHLTAVASEARPAS